MPRQKREFIEGEFYHIVLRRIEDQLLFVDTDDYYRGIFSLYEFNDVKPVIIRERRAARTQFKKAMREIAGGKTPIKIIEPGKHLVFIDKRNLLVEILVFSLMPNHIHLLVRELKRGGISKFMQKFGSGYATYFKNKYGIKLKGHFFQDRFTAIHIKTEEQLKAVFVYIHTNCISLLEPKWKELGIAKPEKAIRFVENYKWLSYQDYIGKKNFPSLTSRDFMLKIMGGEAGCKKWVEAWIKQKGEIKKMIEKFDKLALD
jgi:putative transposase